MPKNENPITQAIHDGAADETLREFGNDIEKVNANQVATRLGMTRANQAFYEKFADWKKRRIEEGVLHAEMAPLQLREGLAQRLELSKQEILAYACGMTGKAVAEYREECGKDKGLYREKVATLETRVVTLQVEVAEKDERIASLEKQLKFAGGQLVVLETQLATERGKGEALQSMNVELIRLAGENWKPVEQAKTDEQLANTQVEDHWETDLPIDTTRYDLETEDDDDEAAA
ncbi:hypothetical protein [Blastomonas sp.]|uniref:hypothetical protein n=1 Tax=Blastomonas sp. TaxID=1909299 RepID=UPI00359301BC